MLYIYNFAHLDFSIYTHAFFPINLAKNMSKEMKNKIIKAMC